MKLLSKAETAKIIGIHSESVMRLVRAGRFPAPVRLGGDGPTFRVRFVEDEVNAWLAQRMAARA